MGNFFMTCVNLQYATAIDLNNNMPGLTWHCVDCVKVIGNKFMILDKIISLKDDKKTLI